jgi:hypothetical protein
MEIYYKISIDENYIIAPIILSADKKCKENIRSLFGEFRV